MIGLIATPNIGGEFSASDNFIDNGWHVMLPNTGTQKVEVILAILIFLSFSTRSRLSSSSLVSAGGKSIGDLAVMIVWDLLKHIFDRIGADFGEHRFDHAWSRIRHPRMRPSCAGHLISPRSIHLSGAIMHKSSHDAQPDSTGADAHHHLATPCCFYPNES